MAYPDKKCGFTAFPNDLLEAVYSADLTITELKIILAIIRYTYGYNRESAEMSITFISSATGINRDHVAKSIRTLVSNNIITVCKEATRTSSKEICVNPDHDLWVIHRGVVCNDHTGVVCGDHTGVVCNDHTGVVCSDHTGVVRSDHTGVVCGDHTGVVCSDHQDINNKIKNNKEKDKEIKEERVYDPEITKVVELFNTVCKDYTPVERINDRIAERVSALLEDFYFDEINKGFEKAQASDFLKGKENGWKASFEWITTSENMFKILSGRYDPRAPVTCENLTFDPDDFFKTALEWTMRQDQ